MKTQLDHKVRTVSLETLEAMCQHVSGSMCHKFAVESVSRSRVHVSYSNEDEWASAHPMTAVYPCFPDGRDKDNPTVVLDLLRVIADNCDGEGWQSFEVLRDCPTLWRDPADQAWYTHAQILCAKHPCQGPGCGGRGCSACGGFRIDPAHNPTPFCHVCAVCDLEPVATLRYGVLSCPRCGGSVEVPPGDIRDNDAREWCLGCSAATGRLVRRYHHTTRMFFMQAEELP